MRTILIFFFALVYTTGYSQNNCSEYFPFEEGVSMEYKNFDRKDKIQSTIQHTIRQLSTVDGLLTAEISTSIADNDEKNVQEGNFTVTCSDGIFTMDLSQLLPAESMQVMGGGEMEMEILGDDFQLPNNPQIGSVLDDAKNTIQFSTGVINMKMELEFTDRKVEARETITTPAGTFDCIRLSYVMNTKMAIVRTSYRNVDWYAEGVGIVRSELYNKKDKLEYYTVLSKFEK
ncbi:MAG: hypothetical protein HRU40_08980 [Saprospiraceae bacterium]|nr:hypothetical protein [Saprospiraceae bacterium]